MGNRMENSSKKCLVLSEWPFIATLIYWSQKISLKPSSTVLLQYLTLIVVDIQVEELYSKVGLHPAFLNLHI